MADWAPPNTRVNVRVLVGAGGAAVRAELIDAGYLPRAIFDRVERCALAERYIPGLDRLGHVAETWTAPFGVIVLPAL